ncbi:MAG: glycosyltransferase family 2 protein [Synergistetes bacterium]|nr:glycosyltransferase family 2 protein [Synergistota bacterium]
MSGGEIWFYLTLFVQFVVALLGGYYVFVYTVGLLPWRREKKAREERFLRFTILIPAHNERDVIDRLIENLKRLDYPSDFYKIIVIADNCTDDTAEVALKSGAIVWRRYDPLKKGKQYALDWAFKRLLEEEDFDAVCVFDADNLVSLNFLRRVNERLLSGEKVVQCYLDTKNPLDSWVTKAYALGYWISNRVFQFARWRLGFSAVLGGTGFSLTRDLLERYALGLTSLTEDLELTVKLNLKGVKVGWIHDAKVYDEKPLTFRESWYQRLRWMRGHWDVALRYGFALLKKAILEGKLHMLDMFFYAISPLRILLGGAIIFFLLLSSFADVGMGGIHTGGFLPFWLWVSISVWVWLYPLVALIQEKVPLRLFPYLFYLVVWSLTWIPVVVQALLSVRVRSWSHTRHTRSLTLEELTNLNFKRS